MNPVRIGAATAIVLSFLAVYRSENEYKSEVQAKPLDNSSFLAHEIFESRKENEEIIVFLHGWPDDASLFRPLAKKLSETGYYKSVNCNLPGYPLPRNFNGNHGTMPKRKWGYSLEEVVLGLKNTIELFPNKKVTLITHDWGAIIGYLLHDMFPRSIHRMISLDIGWRANGNTVPSLIFTLGYQGSLNLFFLLPKPIGSSLTQKLSELLGRTPSKDASAVSNEMNWLYRTAWREIFGKGSTINRMNKYVPKHLPFLFLYAVDRPEIIRFSDSKWLQHVKDSFPGISKASIVPGNHWMVNTNPDELEQLIETWLKESQQATNQVFESKL